MTKVTESPTDISADTITDEITPDETVIESPPGLGKRVFQPQTLLGFLLAGVALFFVYRNGLKLDFRQVWGEMRNANGWILAVAFVVYYSTFAVRAKRWQVLLGNVGYSREQGVNMPSLTGLGEILYLSWFANCVTVARLGDAYRGYMLKRAAGVSFAVTMGTILAERLVDIGVLAGMMSISALLAFRGALPQAAEYALLAGIAVTAVGFVGLASLRRLRPFVQRILPERIFGFYSNIETGVTGSFRRVPLLIGLTLIGWIIEGSTLYLTAAAVNVPLSVAQAIMAALASSLLSTIPFSPAGLGFTESGTVLLLTSYGMDTTPAAAVVLLSRVINYWSIIGFGAVLYVFSRKK
jgi:glycosyltransferase 2 family protein